MEKASLKIAFLAIVLIIASSVPAGEACDETFGIMECLKECPKGGFCRDGKCVCVPSKVAEPSKNKGFCTLAECRATCPPGMPGFCDQDAVCRCEPSA
ncbi:hypothetical protein Tsubulata_031529 [Turnera subulata]|uniref:Uncharacterized protein n=1 Tax=Turnera subulata TaxID=218843 RepID=A0A9Q0FCK6_9ROSI|nr:hypothetical protein Tsubulata_031529 [Turnera subulata]